MSADIYYPFGKLLQVPNCVPQVGDEIYISEVNHLDFAADKHTGGLAKVISITEESPDRHILKFEGISGESCWEDLECQQALLWKKYGTSMAEPTTFCILEIDETTSGL